MLNSLKAKIIYIYLGIFLLIEILSYLSLTNTILNLIIFITITILTLVVAAYRLEYGLLVVLAELMIGSMGRMFVIDLGGFGLSLRMSLWIMVMLVFIFKLIVSIKTAGKKSGYLEALKTFRFRYYFIIIFFFVAIGIVNGWLSGNELNLIFNDANAWLYYLIIFPAIVVYGNSDKEKINRLTMLFEAAVLWLGLKTFWLLYIFTHNLSFSPEAYLWIRKTLVGEITATATGWPRIFIQGQIFAALGLFFCFWKAVIEIKTERKKIITNILAGAFFTGVLLISFSRSFWLALLLALLISLGLVWKFFSLKKMILSGIWLLLVSAFSFSLLFITAIFPYPHPGKFSADFVGRADIANSQEAAISSRWSLLPVLLKEIKYSPWLGQGYGKTITYTSSDPRILEKNPSGEYTTYAFEWGYLDTWLKIGLLGLASYFALIYALLRKGWQTLTSKKNFVILGLASGLIFIAITNFFTPYLNHPLGIGIIVVSACLINKYRVY